MDTVRFFWTGHYTPVKCTYGLKIFGGFKLDFDPILIVTAADAACCVAWNYQFLSSDSATAD